MFKLQIIIYGDFLKYDILKPKWSTHIRTTFVYDHYTTSYVRGNSLKSCKYLNVELIKKVQYYLGIQFVFYKAFFSN